MPVTVTLNPVADLTNTVTAKNTINNNSTAVMSGFTQVVAVAGDTMQGNLDMNSNRILNLASATSLNEPVRVRDMTSSSIVINFPSMSGVINATGGGTLVSTFSGTGNIPLTQIASGAGASASTFLRGDNTWASPTVAGVAFSTGATDSNITISLSGSSTSALVSTATVAVGWAGTLALARGGAATAITASAGGLVFSNATSMQVTTSATAANKIWLSAITATPVLSTSVWPATAPVNSILFASATSTWAATSTIISLTIQTSTLQTVVLQTATASNFTVTTSTFSNITINTGTYLNATITTSTFSNMTINTATVANITINTGTLSTITMNAATATTLTMVGTTIGTTMTLSGNLTWTTGTVGPVGVTDTSNAAAGNWGEYASTSITTASALALVSATASNVMGLSLTPGDWDIRAQHAFTTGTVITAVSLLGGGINSTTVFPSTSTAFSQMMYPNTSTFAASGHVVFWTGPARFSIAATTTFQNVVTATFSTGTVRAWGALSARRVR